MAKKRMFDFDLLNTDDFVEMPHESQTLYLHLNMHADDEGFVQPKRIMRMVGAKDDSLKNLFEKGFLIPLSNGVVVVTHWHMNNYLNSKRIRKTIHQNQRKQVMLSDQGKYECLTDVKPMFNQNRIEEYRVEENRINIDYEIFELKLADFIPECYEESKILELTQDLGEENFPYLIGIYKKHGYTPIEHAWGIYRDLDKTKLSNKGAYFNSLVSSYLESR